MSPATNKQCPRCGDTNSTVHNYNNVERTRYRLRCKSCDNLWTPHGEQKRYISQIKIGELLATGMTAKGIASTYGVTEKSAIKRIRFYEKSNTKK